MFAIVGLVIGVIQQCSPCSLRYCPGWCDEGFLPSRVFQAFLVMCNMAYIMTAEYGISLFSCFRDGSGVLHPMLFPALRCYGEGDEWNLMYPVGIVCLVVVFMYPAVLSFVLWRNKDDITSFTSTPSLEARLGWFFLRLKPERYWWECLLIVKKLVIVFFITYFNDSFVPLVGSFTVSFAVFSGQLKIQPYNMNFINMVEMMLMIVEIFITFLALCFATPTFPNLETEETLRYLFIVFGLAGLTIGFVSICIESCSTPRRPNSGHKGILMDFKEFDDLM
eukprot:GFYU01003773.1.p2 GENE.GFYU01003773.1~~GFYU01003773.1.p2  ORF type:complete len:279 (+),score=65.88 GFYU01003773.1:506-1342(+)